LRVLRRLRLLRVACGDGESLLRHLHHVTT